VQAIGQWATVFIMTLDLQQQLINHGPMALLVSSMVLTGSFINMGATDKTVQPSKSWCVNTTTTTTIDAEFVHLLSTMPTSLRTATVIIVIIFPLIPVLFNSQTKHWNRFKVEILKCHVVGQGSVFGVAEILRRLMTVPGVDFLAKCNITDHECSAKAEKSYQLPFNDNSSAKSFCHNNEAKPTDLFDSLHHFPDKTCCVIGASIVTFMATLYYWNRINVKGKPIYEAHSIKHCMLILIQILCVVLVLAYLYVLYMSFESVQLYGLLIGAFLQLLVVFTTLPAKNENI
jgi:hypothetical protein